jgi:hypothetical protein
MYFFLEFTFIELMQNSKVNNVQNVFKVQTANTKSSAEQHGPPRKCKARIRCLGGVIQNSKVNNV